MSTATYATRAKIQSIVIIIYVPAIWSLSISCTLASPLATPRFNLLVQQHRAPQLQETPLPMTRIVVHPFICPPPHFLNDCLRNGNLVAALVLEGFEGLPRGLSSGSICKHRCSDNQGLSCQLSFASFSDVYGEGHTHLKNCILSPTVKHIRNKTSAKI